MNEKLCFLSRDAIRMFVGVCMCVCVGVYLYKCANIFYTLCCLRSNCHFRKVCFCVFFFLFLVWILFSSSPFLSEVFFSFWFHFLFWFRFFVRIAKLFRALSEDMGIAHDYLLQHWLLFAEKIKWMARWMYGRMAGWVEMVFNFALISTCLML